MLTCLACGARTSVDVSPFDSGAAGEDGGDDGASGDAAGADAWADGSPSDGSTADGVGNDGRDVDGGPGDGGASDDARGDGGVVCPVVCRAGETRCVPGGISSCVSGEDGCLAWGEPVPCPLGQACAAGPPVACAAVAAPRPLAPLSTATVTSQRPIFHWAIEQGIDGAQVDVCADRACGRTVTSFTALGSGGAPVAPLAPGLYFFRLHGVRNGAVGFATSAVWEFQVGARSAPVNTSWGTVADVNGDGFADAIVGAPQLDSLTGAVEVHLGSAGGLSMTADATLTPPAGTGPFPEFGYSVASAGDVNGDGFADVVIGAPNGGGGGPGTVYVYLGGAAGLAATPLALTGRADKYYFGYSVASAGDLNGDGYADVVVAQPPAGNASGAVSIYLGGASGLGTSPAAVVGSNSPVASAGDVDGDGYGDIVVTDFGASGFAGSVSVYRGSPSGLSGPTALPGPTRPDSFFGFSASCAGDVNADGYADVVVGAPGVRPAIYIYLGGPSGPSTVRAMFADPSNSPVLLSYPTNFNFGESVGSAGDVNGDGYADVVVGAPMVASRQGAAYVYFGGVSGLAATPAQVTLTASSGFAQAVAGVGDVNRDGYGDLLLGAPGISGGTGEVYFYRGSASGTFIGPIPMTGSGRASNFGFSLASLTAGAGRHSRWAAAHM